jgi:hypothetical protein
MLGSGFLGIIDGLGGFRRHVVLVVLGQYFAGGKVPSAVILPWATTPLPSLNRSGRMPL